jgi:hypothetical protein
LTGESSFGAHEISEANRGLTLERVLALTLLKFPAARVFFSSPLRSNAEYLLTLFGTTRASDHFVEHLSPVTHYRSRAHFLGGGAPG